ncbi:hypothetical protein A6R73_16225 [Xanthomonas translucens pv. poae]|uniref:Uncharacterized protein n=1 Tax=Xanthomonas graminis pv. poae TaxID=227946 RepID=A0A199P3E6_9XANT|nr:hypothetical protein A6R73_16225 [Xanthomonas translucens pv. poae]
MRSAGVSTALLQRSRPCGCGAPRPRLRSGPGAGQRRCEEAADLTMRSGRQARAPGTARTAAP